MVTKPEQTNRVKVCLNVVLEGKYADAWQALQARLESIQLDQWDNVGPSNVLRYAVMLAAKQMEEDIALSKMMRQPVSKPN